MPASPPQILNLENAEEVMIISPRSVTNLPSVIELNDVSEEPEEDGDSQFPIQNRSERDEIMANLKANTNSERP